MQIPVVKFVQTVHVSNQTNSLGDEVNASGDPELFDLFDECVLSALREHDR